MSSLEEAWATRLCIHSFYSTAHKSTTIVYQYFYDVRRMLQQCSAVYNCTWKVRVLAEYTMFAAYSTLCYNNALLLWRNISSASNCHIRGKISCATVLTVVHGLCDTIQVMKFAIHRIMSKTTMKHFTRRRVRIENKFLLAWIQAALTIRRFL